MALMLTIVHGPAVSGAMNTIVASRAAKDLISSLASDLLTIGSRSGGALNEAAAMVKSVNNHDLRVEYVLKNFPSHTLLDYALAVEKITTKKDTAGGYIKIGTFNGLFVLGRSIGFIGHYLGTFHMLSAPRPRLTVNRPKASPRTVVPPPTDDISIIMPDVSQPPVFAKMG
ncbi:unnamed protein product [Rhizoctonia solani]|uniref:Uncharacterized protein n=1 Tax=Rhizoctonia solani TaxID=456999 RepID=A0A8H3DUQ2_9AGAM|nr:unnamed protein product [Rhizoctonia solani]